jgi:hypothetical protein
MQIEKAVRCHKMIIFLKNNATAVFAALILSAVLLMTSGCAYQPARAQTDNTGGLFGTSNFKDQIVKGGNHVMDQIIKGGAGFLNTTAASLPNVRAHFGTWQSQAL